MRPLPRSRVGGSLMMPCQDGRGGRGAAVTAAFRLAGAGQLVARPCPSGNPYPFTNPPFYVISHGYDMDSDITISGIFIGKMSYSCHIHVIPVFQKRYIWIYLVYPNISFLKNKYDMDLTWI